MSAEPEKKPIDKSRRAVILATVGIVVILGLVLFVGFHVAPLRKTRALVRDVHAWRVDRYHRPELRRILTPFEPPPMRCASGLRSPWWYRHLPPELHPDRLGAPDRAAKRLSAYFRMPDREAPHKEEAVYLLGLCGKPAVPTLIDALKHRGSDVRTIAAVSLGRVGPDAKAAVPALVKALVDSEAQVRWRATEALGVIGPETKEAVAALEKLLDDPNEEQHVRAAAAAALKKIRGEEAGE